MAAPPKKKIPIAIKKTFTGPPYIFLRERERENYYTQL